ncbi:alanine--tRNA ligase-related protein [endosymbiont GvMRE of Glomus versiforme]|uniref:alanine--tRNA ligase-related protein n=1 Tax=endosymbiont GvMRE of Glomus versiforme TaxID=2039283 RepID=UPI000ECD5D88|nr:alanine--tRNA ligase-related protein [endosymbiont GvMRE of Glomus versiforme]RHZ36689.1 Alanine--tRNA ligase [endosymbiont GvMRE of Glomus versiforme]
MTKKNSRKSVISTNEVRKKWLSFFQQKGYYLLEPVSLVPQNDPSLLWINSGVATLKKYFSNPSLAPSRNLVNCQRVIRTDDLTNINQYSYHQTLFEMLGVFSIGGKFKQETIPYFWEFFTSPEWLGLAPERLFITVYQQDADTYKFWKEQKGILREHILYGSKKTNVWDMGGDNSPWGYNTEIYYDFQTNQDIPKNAADLDNKRFLEICNIVFPEFYHQGDNDLPLKEKCVDVGGGLERIAMVVQSKKNTFEIDLWEPVIQLIKERHSNKYK